MRKGLRTFVAANVVGALTCDDECRWSCDKDHTAEAVLAYKDANVGVRLSYILLCIQTAPRGLLAFLCTATLYTK